MSSILTNNSAMVALQTLKSINSNLGKIQSEISTGKTIESAKDNAAVWAISKVMESDVAGFNAISDSLALGQATVGVALNASESVTDLLNEIKGKIVSSQESNVDRGKIQTDIEALTNQVNSIIGAAQFNGLNLLNGADTADVDILSSLDRSATGSVTAGEISVGRSNLTTADIALADTAQLAGGVNGGAANVTTTAGAGGVATTGTVTIAANNGVAGASDVGGIAFAMVLSGGAGQYAAASTSGLAVAVTTTQISYVASDGDTAADIAKGLEAAYIGYAMDNDIDLGADDALQIKANGNTLEVTVAGADGATLNAVGVEIAVNTPATALPAAQHTAAGKLNNLSKIDVSTEAGAGNALMAIEGLINTSIDTAAALGSSGRQIETQSDFVGKLSDLLTSGIGSLVDADMEAASARLQALQTQQQLGVQALSIANQAPQTILSLFR